MIKIVISIYIANNSTNVLTGLNFLFNWWDIYYTSLYSGFQVMKPRANYILFN